jgi:hypothetical protein
MTSTSGRCTNGKVSKISRSHIVEEINFIRFTRHYRRYTPSVRQHPSSDLSNTILLLRGHSVISLLTRGLPPTMRRGPSAIFVDGSVKWEDLQKRFDYQLII